VTAFGGAGGGRKGEWKGPKQDLRTTPGCQMRSSPVCMVMNKLPSHPPVFILTPSQRPTLICIYTPDLTTSSYSKII
jgi:hypothetical protein